MVSCEALHRQYDSIANGPVQVGELPDWMNLRGRVIWYVYAGPYKDISEEGWGVFMQKVMSSDMKPRGTPGDVYVCDPDDHKADHQEKCSRSCGLRSSSSENLMGLWDLGRGAGLVV